MGKEVGVSEETKTGGQKVPSIVAHVMAVRRAERQAKCPVCRLPDEVRAQLRIAREKGYSRLEQLSYLKIVAPKVTELDFNGHASGAHEAKEKAGL